MRRSQRRFRRGFAGTCAWAGAASGFVDAGSGSPAAAPEDGTGSLMGFLPFPHALRLELLDRLLERQTPLARRGERVVALRRLLPGVEPGERADPRGGRAVLEEDVVLGDETLVEVLEVPGVLHDLLEGRVLD